MTDETSGELARGTAKLTFDRPVFDRYFEDYVPGIEYTCEIGALSESEIIRFAKEFDPQSIHTDPVAAMAGPFGGIIASGLHTAGITTRTFMTSFLNTHASMASPGIDNIRWTQPVRPGDRLEAQFTVVEQLPSSSKPDRGIVRTQVTVRNQQGHVVLTLLSMNILRRR